MIHSIKKVRKVLNRELDHIGEDIHSYIETYIQELEDSGNRIEYPSKKELVQDFWVYLFYEKVF